MTFAKANAWRDRFAAVPFEDKGGSHPSRYYQDIAVERVLEAIAERPEAHPAHARHRHGQDLHRVSDRVEAFHSRWNLSREPSRRPRILFLADRNILADQAYNAFSAFPRTPGAHRAGQTSARKGKVPKNGSLFFTIFQTFMSGRRRTASRRPISASIRRTSSISSSSTSAIAAARTTRATGAASWITFARRAARPHRHAQAQRQRRHLRLFRRAGVHLLAQGRHQRRLPHAVQGEADSTTLDDYVYTPDDKVVEGEIESGKRYTEPTSTRSSRSREREAHRVKLFMEQINQNEKTLVFCATQDHALAVRDLINQMKTSKDPNYCQRVTANDGALGEQHLRDFQDNEKTIPTILTTSQKLSTGVDARNIRNIVLMRPINSMIEFKQIIGRGTRLYDGKDYFTIYDFVKAHHFSDPEWDGEPIEPEPKPKPEPSRAAHPAGHPGKGRPRIRSVSASQKDQSETRRRKGAHHPAHDDDHVLASRRHADVRAAVHGNAFRQAARFFKGRGRTARFVERAGYPRQAPARVWPRKVSATSNWPRCRRSSTPRRAICSTCSPMSPTPAAAHPRGPRHKCESLYQLPIHHQAAGLPRFRAVPLRERRRGGTRSETN
jgi:type I restriction enzyme R subunit